MKTRILLISMMVFSSLLLSAQTVMNINQSNGTVLQIPFNTIDSITYTITNPGNLATISTLAIGNITSNSATSGGNISNNGGTPVTQRGVVWSTSQNPTTANNSTSDGSGTGNFTSNLINLTANTTYYVRAYATNSGGTAYGNELSFTTNAAGGGIVTSPGAGVTFDGYNYSSIILGNGQEWMTENLRSSIYANGDLIPNITDPNLWNNLNSGAWVHYNHDSQFENPYGKLYNGYVVNDSRNVCPSGWHVPSDPEWTMIIDYLGGNLIAGSKMKTIDSQYWLNSNGNATNISGFSGLPGSHWNGGFGTMGYVGNYRSSTASPSGYLWTYTLNGIYDECFRSEFGNSIGFSIRCLKDYSSLLVNAITVMNIHQSNGTVLQIPMNMIDSITYTITNPGNLATISTLPIGNITSTSATSGGNISNNGGTPVTQRGVVWSTSQNPTTANNSTSDGSGTGNFTSNLINLTANTTYYVRAYATNSAGTAYGNELTFTTTEGIITNPGAGVTFDGFSYASIVLGNGQEWMAENLRTTTYANGDPIPNVTDGNQWSVLTTGAWAHYNNDNQYENPYGKLYNWYTVADTRNVCPTGWHVPTDAEWSALINYLDPNANGGNTEPNTAGGKMKSIGTQLWQSPNLDATNESGFSALPGGQRATDGAFGVLGSCGNWWSNTEETGVAWYRDIVNYDGGAYRSNTAFSEGNSIRCLKD